LLLVACGGPTEIVLYVSSDLTQDELAAVKIVTSSSRAGSATQTRCACVGDECLAPDAVRASWPLTDGLRPGHAEGDAFVVEIQGMGVGTCEAEPRVTQRARLSFRPGRRLLLRMSLVGRCLDRRCDALDSTCRDGVCVPLDGFEPDDITGAPVPLFPPGVSSPDASSTDLAGVDLAGVDLAGVDLAQPTGPGDMAAGVSGYRRCVVVNGVQTGECIADTAICAIGTGCLGCTVGLAATTIDHFSCPAIQVSANMCMIPQLYCD
jgi:hypothetical protein